MISYSYELQNIFLFPESLVLPTIEICPCSPDYVDGYFQGEMGKMSTLYLNGTDFDGGNVTFRLAPESSLANVDVTGLVLLDFLYRETSLSFYNVKHV